MGAYRTPAKTVVYVDVDEFYREAYAAGLSSRQRDAYVLDVIRDTLAAQDEEDPATCTLA